MYDSKTLWEVVTHCVILHNMIIEDKHDGAAHTNDFEKFREHIRPQNKMSMLLAFLRHIDNFEINKGT